MDLTNEVLDNIGKAESSKIDYKAVLPPSRNIAQLIGAFANTDGGLIILGASKDADGKIEINGLSDDFHANAITHKALDLIVPRPNVEYQYVLFQNKKLYAIKIPRSVVGPVMVEGNIYVRTGGAVKLANGTDLIFKANGYPRIKGINNLLQGYKQRGTNAKLKVLEHYQSILKMMDDLGTLLYPVNANTLTTVQEGKILSRILFSSFVDNFETYLSDLLYEIFLSNPATLKSTQTVTVEEVLNCSDLQEFVKYLAKQRLSKLQKGSVKGFIRENRQISQLGVIDEPKQSEIEKILQIRHLYSHRNGIVDEKFLQYFVGEFTLNSEHQLSVDDICDRLEYLAGIINQIDEASTEKYKLSVINQ